MSDNNQFGPDGSDAQDVNKTAEKGQGVDQSRRKFSKTGLIAAPVIMSLASKPVLGNQCSLSGMLSTTFSGPDESERCGGLTPGFWKTHPDYWPQYSKYPGKITCVTIGGNNKPNVTWDRSLATTMFTSVFGLTSSPYNEMTLMNVAWAGGDVDQYELGAHAIAAWFNSQRSEFVYGMTPDEVVTKFQAAMAGTYSNSYSSTSAGPREALKKEFQLLNSDRNGLTVSGEDYGFLQISSYWIDQATYDSWKAGTLSCGGGNSGSGGKK